MRILKNKIARAHEFQLRKKLSLQNPLPKKDTMTHSSVSEEIKSYPSSPGSNQKRSGGGYITPLKTRATKSVVKNYGKAICSFACSELARPYLDPIITAKNIKYEEFIKFMLSAKESIDSLHSFRSLLLITDKDDAQTVAFKQTFSLIGEVFINYFSVNWIFSGKVIHKEAHLKSRFKILRRIKNPELFTYLKCSSRN